MVTYHFLCCFEMSNAFSYNVQKYGSIRSAEQETIVRNVNLASNRDSSDRDFNI